jgi:hypothetical protein
VEAAHQHLIRAGVHLVVQHLRHSPPGSSPCTDCTSSTWDNRTASSTLCSIEESMLLLLVLCCESKSLMQRQQASQAAPHIKFDMHSSVDGIRKHMTRPHHSASPDDTIKELLPLTELIQHVVLTYSEGSAVNCTHPWVEPEPPPTPATQTSSTATPTLDNDTRRLLLRLSYLYFLHSRDGAQASLLSEIINHTAPIHITPQQAPAGPPSSCDGRIMAIVEAGEGEMGQTVFRDLFLSFTLPVGIVGCRWETLMTRSQHTRARAAAPTTVAQAHTLAMRGAPAAWQAAHCNDDASARVPFDIERTCSLLCGLCMLLSSDSESIRTGPAFRGLVQLPFLVSEAPSECASKIIQRGDSWFLIVPDSSTPTGVSTHTYGTGIECMCRCILALVSLCGV